MRYPAIAGKMVITAGETTFKRLLKRKIFLKQNLCLVATFSAFPFYKQIKNAPGLLKLFLSEEARWPTVG